MEEIPFPDLKIQSADFLDTIVGRSKCQVCEKSRKFYCYTCYKPLKQIEDRVPRVKVKHNFYRRDKILDFLPLAKNGKWLFFSLAKDADQLAFSLKMLEQIL